MKKSSQSPEDVSSQPFTKTGIFPRSIGRTVKKILSDISPNADQEFIKKYLSKKSDFSCLPFFSHFQKQNYFYS